jgi:hypothetical protein
MQKKAELLWGVVAENLVETYLSLSAWTMHFQSMVKEKPAKCTFKGRPYSYI